MLILAGSHCNSQCPDELLLGELTSNNWHIGVKSTIAVLIVGISIISVLIKLTFAIWLYHLEKKLNDYLRSFLNKKKDADYVVQQARTICLSNYSLPYIWL